MANVNDVKEKMLVEMLAADNLMDRYREEFNTKINAVLEKLTNDLRADISKLSDSEVAELGTKIIDDNLNGKVNKEDADIMLIIIGERLAKDSNNMIHMMIGAMILDSMKGVYHGGKDE